MIIFPQKYYNCILILFHNFNCSIYIKKYNLFISFIQSMVLITLPRPSTPASTPLRLKPFADSVFSRWEPKPKASFQWPRISISLTRASACSDSTCCSRTTQSRATLTSCWSTYLCVWASALSLPRTSNKTMIQEDVGRS